MVKKEDVGRYALDIIKVVVDKVGAPTLAICLTIFVCFSIFGGVIIHKLNNIYWAIPDSVGSDYSDDISQIKNSLSSIDDSVSSINGQMG